MPGEDVDFSSGARGDGLDRPNLSTAEVLAVLKGVRYEISRFPTGQRRTIAPDALFSRDSASCESEQRPCRVRRLRKVLAVRGWTAIEGAPPRR